MDCFFFLFFFFFLGGGEACGGGYEMISHLVFKSNDTMNGMFLRLIQWMIVFFQPMFSMFKCLQKLNLKMLFA